MADHGAPHFQNDIGAAAVEVGSREFMCIGARPPFDHPHIYIDMGDRDEIICSYCSTLYRFNPALKAGTCAPAECLWVDEPAAA